MTNAQTHIDRHFPSAGGEEEIKVVGSKPAETLDGKEITDKLKGKLEIKNNNTVTKIVLSGHELEELTVINCPNLEEVEVNGNRITKFDITKAKTTDGTDAGGPGLTIKLTSILIGDNPDLEEISVEYCPKLQRILALGSDKLNVIKGLDRLEELEAVLTKPGLVRQVISEKVDY
jgi:Leucine-rich repeat (LRR) protein